MKFHFICRQDLLSTSQFGEKLKIVKEYITDTNITSEIESYLVDYISSTLEEGKKQGLLALEHKNSTPEEINQNDNLPYNHYFIFQDNSYILLQKSKSESEITEGYLWATTKKIYTPETKPVAKFDLITHNIDLYDYVPRTVATPETKKQVAPTKNYTYMTQLKSLLMNMSENNIKVSDLDVDITKYNFKKPINLEDF